MEKMDLVDGRRISGNPGYPSTDNQMLEDDDPNKFIAKMGADAVKDLLMRLDLDQLSLTLRHQAANETSQQSKSEA
jgi:DNA-directed RNA polymerase subunit beta'